MLGSVDQPRGVSPVEALNNKFEAARFPHLLLDKGKGSDPSNHIIMGEDRRPTPTSRTGHLSKLKPNLPTNRPRIIGVESM